MCQPYRAPLIECDDDESLGAIEVVYNRRGDPVQLNLIVFSDGDLQLMRVTPIGPFDDVDEMVAGAVRELRNAPRQLRLI